MRNTTSWKLLAGSAVLAALVAAQPAAAASQSAQPTLVLADAAPAADATPAGGIAPMPDAAVQGAACLGAAAAAIGTTYAIGPSELMMLLTGAMHVPSGSAVMFIPMVSILGGGTCAMAAAATPAVSWAIDQSDNIGAQFASLGGLLGGRAAGVEDAAKDSAPAPVRAMTETEIQGAGCVAGALAGFGASMATAPMEVTMLSSGATTIVSSTPILAVGLLGTIVASSCGIGALASLPVVALFSNLSTISGSITQAASGAVSQATAFLGGGRGGTVMVAEGGVAAR